MNERYITSLLLAAGMVGLFIIVALQGCAQLAPVRDKVVQAVEAYCKEPLEARLALRASVNESLARAGASVKVTCSGDPD